MPRELSLPPSTLATSPSLQGRISHSPGLAKRRRPNAARGGGGKEGEAPQEMPSRLSPCFMSDIILLQGAKDDVWPSLPLPFLTKKSLLLLLNCECIQKVQFRMNVSPLINCSFPLHFCQRISACFLARGGWKKKVQIYRLQSHSVPRKKEEGWRCYVRRYSTHMCVEQGGMPRRRTGQEKKGSVVVHSSRRSCLDSGNSKKIAFYVAFPGE